MGRVIEQHQSTQRTEARMAKYYSEDSDQKW